MPRILQSYWFLITLTLIVIAGLSAGANLPARQMDVLIGWVRPGVTTTIVLFLMAFSLDSRHLHDAFRSPGPVLWAVLVNYGFVPLLAWPLMSLQRLPDFALGLMITASVPCTLATASVWTRKAGGNDAVSLLVTLATNGLCLILTPLWLVATTAQSVRLDPWEMSVTLGLTVLVPTLVGQLARLSVTLRDVATQYRTPIGVLAQLLVLLLVLTAACEGGSRLRTSRVSPGVVALGTVWLTCVAIHVAAMLAGWEGSRLLGHRRADAKAVVFAGSQKTLPIGLLLATDPAMFGGLNLPFLVFPLLLYHVSQLFLDTAVAQRLALNSEVEPQRRGVAEKGNGNHH